MEGIIVLLVNQKINKMKKNIEIEFRSIITKEDYNRVGRYLKINAVDLGVDDKDVYFFILKDKLFKVVNNVNKKTAKIVLKLTKIGHGTHFEEIEINIKQVDFEKATGMFKKLDFSDKIMRTYQKRHNFDLNGVEVALKWSEIWGYHIELEKIIHNIKSKALAEEKIKTVADELKIKLMSEKELRDFIKKIENRK